jgi:hypothetical protein
MPAMIKAVAFAATHSRGVLRSAVLCGCALALILAN